MGELLVVAFLGGLITGLSPCIVPVIPVVMAGGSAGTSKWRPYVIIAGLVVSFSVSVLFASSLLGFLHLPQDLLFWLGVALLGLLSVGLLIPRIGEVIERPFARLGASRYANEGGGFVLGLSLGLVFVPCAGPVLTAISVAAAHHHAGATLALRHALLRARRHHPAPRAGGGRPARHDLVVLAAQPPAHRPQGGRRRAGRGHLGHRLQLARRPAARRARLHQRPGGPHRVDRFRLHAAPAPERRAPEPVRRRQRPARRQEGHLRRDRSGQLAEWAPGRPERRQPRRPRRPPRPVATEAPVFMANKTNLPNLGQAPNFAGITAWFNTPGNKPLSLSQLRGKVVLIDFWTYSCINCQRALPHVEGWYNDYKKDGLVVVGVSAPEFAFEHVVSNVESAAGNLGIDYPVAVDDNLAPGTPTTTSTGRRSISSTRRASCAPTTSVRATTPAWRTTSGCCSAPTGSPTSRPAPTCRTRPRRTSITPESYVGDERLNNAVGTAVVPNKAIVYHPPVDHPVEQLAFGGTWTVHNEEATAGNDATLGLQFTADDVYLVMSGEGTVGVSFNGKHSRR